MIQNTKTALAELTYGLALLGLWASTTAQELWVDGVTEPGIEARLSAEVAGVIDKIHFKEGQFIEKGTVILELRNQRELSEVKRAEATLKLQTAERDRIRALKTRTQSVREGDLEKAEANFLTAQADFELAGANLAARKIAAPFDGYVTDFFGHEIGEGAALTDSLVHLVDPRTVSVVCNIDAALAFRVKEEDTVDVEFAGSEGTLTRKATITFVSKIVDPASGLLRIRATFSNEDEVIRPGVAAKLRIP